MQAALIKSLTGVTFDLTSSFINDWTGLGVTGLGQNARVANARRGRGGTVTVFLGFEMLLPLLRNGLTLAERKVESFYIGVSLLHEVVSIYPFLSSISDSSILSMSHIPVLKCTLSLGVEYCRNSRPLR